MFHKDSPVAYVLIGDIEEKREGLSPIIKHLKYIQTITNIILVAIENKRLYKIYRKEAYKELSCVANASYAYSSDSLPKQSS